MSDSKFALPAGTPGQSTSPRTPATLLGQQAEVGSLRQGCSADFVVFDGDLLDLSARHVATWVDGVHVYGESHSHSPNNSRANR